MKKLRPCPDCGGEVEMEFLGLEKYTGEERYFLFCKKCYQRVVCGIGFGGETKQEARERIQQFKYCTRKDGCLMCDRLFCDGDLTK